MICCSLNMSVPFVEMGKKIKKCEKQSSQKRSPPGISVTSQWLGVFQQVEFYRKISSAGYSLSSFKRDQTVKQRRCFITNANFLTWWMSLCALADSHWPPGRLRDSSRMSNRQSSISGALRADAAGPLGSVRDSLRSSVSLYRPLVSIYRPLCPSHDLFTSFHLFLFPLSSIYPLTSLLPHIFWKSPIPAPQRLRQRLFSYLYSAETIPLSKSLNWPPPFFFLITSPLSSSIFSFCSVCLNGSRGLGDWMSHFDMWYFFLSALSLSLLLNITSEPVDFSYASCHTGPLAKHFIFW